MTDRTAEIIMVLKGNHNMEIKDHKGNAYYYDLIATYLHHDCDVDLDFYYTAYGKNCIYREIEKAVTDYIGTADQKVSFMSDYFRYVTEDRTDAILSGSLNITDDTPDDFHYRAWCDALRDVQVRDDSGYINGFTEENTKDYIA